MKLAGGMGAVLVVVLLGIAGAQAAEIVLISPDEAKLPSAAQANLTMRAGITRGPQISLVSPKPDSKDLTSPVHLQVKFDGRGGATIDPDSIKVTYLKSPAIDLTARLKDFTKAAGIDVDQADVPAGTHSIKIDVRDSEGRSGSTVLNFDVAK